MYCHSSQQPLIAAMMNYFGNAEKKEEFLQDVKTARNERALEMKKEHRIILLQSLVRGWLARRHLRQKIIDEFDSVFGGEQSLKPALFVFQLTGKIFFVWNKDGDRNRFCNLCRYITKSLEEDNPCYSYVGVFLLKEHSVCWISQLKEILKKCNYYLSSIFDDVSLNLVTIQNTFVVLLHTMVSLTSISTWRIFNSASSLSENLQILKPGLNQLCVNTVAFLLRHNFYFTLKEILCRAFTPSFGANKLPITNTSLMAIMILAFRPLSYSSFTDRVLTLYVENILTIPAVLHHVFNICPQFFKSSDSEQLLDRVVTLVKYFEASSDCDFTEKRPYFMLNVKESNGLLCFTANLIELGSIHSDYLLMKSKELEFVEALSSLLKKCKQIVTTTRSSNLTQWHPIFGWFLQDGYNISTHESLPLIQQQLSLLWTRPFISLLLENPIRLYLDFVGSTDSSNSAGSTANGNSFRSKAWNFIADATNINIRWKTSDFCQKISNGKLFLDVVQSKLLAACVLYHSTIKIFIQLRLDILTGLCYQSEALNLFWRYLSSQNGGLKYFYRFVSSSSKVNELTSDVNCQILLLFCECLIHYITILDDVEMYEQQSVFSLPDFLLLSAFLNNFLYRGIVNDVFRQECGIESVNELFASSYRLLSVLYLRDCRRPYTASKSHWIVKDIKWNSFFQELEKNKKNSFLREKMPHIIPYQERYNLLKKRISLEKNCSRDMARQSEVTGVHSVPPNFPLPIRLIKIRRNHIVEDAFHSLYRLSSAELKQPFRIKFLNKEGLEEAGVDQAGIFKEFLVDLIQKLFDPSLNLFRKTSHGHAYPSLMNEISEINHLDLIEFSGKMLAKAIFEGIVLDIRLASFFLSQIVGQNQSAFYSYLDDLPSLDEELYRSLMYIKRYEGQVEDLCLTFSTTEECFGAVVNRELVPGGKAIGVTKYNKIIYIHLMAHFRMHTQIKRQTAAFSKGFYSLLSKDSISLFSVPELQLLISGEDEPLNLEQLRRNTQYYGGFHDSHKVIVWLWDILKNDFVEEERGLFLKFVTSNSKPPVLGFGSLNPPFSIRCVEVGEDEDLGDSVGSVIRGFFTIRKKGPELRLPTSSTCFNLLKLPNYSRKHILRDKLKYAITANSGFELS